MTIGAFSRASLLSIKALRNYHENGLLVPQFVDPETGYRFYSIAQLADAAVVRRLRSFELSLSDIAMIVEAKDPAITRRVLERHSAAMADRLAATERIIGDLQRGLDEPGIHTPATVKMVSE